MSKGRWGIKEASIGRPRSEPVACAYEGCPRVSRTKGLCDVHYTRQRSGTPMDRPMPLPLEERFWSKVDKTDTCWLWTACLTTEGYGSFACTFEGEPRRNRLAHRVSWVLVGKELPPKGMHLDHLCRVRHCVNPNHLEPVTRRENILRGVGPSAANALKTNCKRGHELSGSNVVVNRVGARVCLICKRSNQKVSRAKRKAREAA